MMTNLDRYKIATKFKQGFVAAILVKPMSTSDDPHWQAGYSEGYGARAVFNQKLDEYLVSIGSEPMAVIRIQATEASDRCGCGRETNDWEKSHSEGWRKFYAGTELITACDQCLKEQERQWLRMASLAQQLRDQTAAVQFRTSKFGVRRRLKVEQREQAAAPFGAEPDRLVASKIVLDTKAQQFQSVMDVLRRARRYWKSMTVFYPVRGIRLIRRDLIDTYEAQMKQFKLELSSALGGLMSGYKDMKSAARKALGALYNAADYPDPDSMADEFNLEWSYPSVEPPDYLRELNPHLYEQQQALVAAQFEQAMATAQAALAAELQDLIGHLVQKLSPGADGKKKQLNDKALSGLREFVERFKQISVHTSPELEQLIATADHIAREVDVTALKASPEGQQQLFTDLSQAKAALDQMLIDAPSRKIDLEDEDE